MVTMKDVARHAQVSGATVSRILNGVTGQASEETQRRVMEAVRELRYVPNSMARNLRRQDSRAWTLLLPTIDNPFVTQLARGIEDVAQASGFGVLMCNTYDDPDKERNYLREAEMDRSSGVIITPTSPLVDVEMLLELGIPIVSILRPLQSSVRGGGFNDHQGFDTVLNDTADTSRRATAYLLQAGHRRIACLPGLHDDYTDERRLAGFLQAHKDHGVEPINELIRHSPISIEISRAIVQDLLRNNAPDAILMANSMIAIGAIGALIAQGIDPSRGPALFSCDSASWTDVLAPYMSVAHQPAYEFGQTAARMLLERLADPARDAQTVYLEAALDYR